MRYLILSDIHANIQALTAVLADAKRRGYDDVLVLGDLVGYGGDPGPAIEMTMDLQAIAAIRGNHDKVCAGIAPATEFTAAARVAAEWTQAVLTAPQRQQLVSLPMGPRTVSDGLMICHGAPFDEDHYIFSEADANRALRAVTARLCLFGHTHVPAVFGSSPAEITLESATETITLPQSGQLLVNVGSVGQPRDGDPRAAYGVLDTSAGTIELRRVEYDIAGAQASIRDAGLPDWLADRLEMGR